MIIDSLNHGYICIEISVCLSIYDITINVFKISIVVIIVFKKKRIGKCMSFKVLIYLLLSVSVVFHFSKRP